MCGRFSYWDSSSIINTYFCEASFEIPNNYNVAPSSYIPVITQARTVSIVGENAAASIPYSRRNLEAMRWGLVPEWAKADSHKGYINARSETINTKPSFKENFLHRRCVVPARGFYEWDSSKQPFFVTLESKHMAFAGIWDGGSSSIAPSVAILTQASTKLHFLHNRVPVVLEGKQDIDIWLDPRSSEKALLAILEKSNDASFIAYQVNKSVGNPRNNEARLLEPLK